MRSRVRVRAYRGGAALIVLPGGAKILTGSPAGRALRDLAEQTSRRIDLVVGDAALDGYEIGERWLPWIDDPEDRVATEWREHRCAQLELVRGHFAALRRAAPQAFPGRLPRGAGARYLSAGSEMEDAAGIAGLRARIQHPPRDADFLARLSPAAGLRYLSPSRTGRLHANAILPFPVERRATERPAAALSPGEEKALQNLEMRSVEALAEALSRVAEATGLSARFEFAGRLIPIQKLDFRTNEWRRDEYISVPGLLSPVSGKPSPLRRSRAAPKGTRLAESPFRDAA